ncbi:MAG: DNA polymerase III subunit beta [Candidatus Taylorbacteria bacterium RIFCSPHIGHO2_01_FULL_46_22b]|uniref:Beta sliding clamp n=1 Tax=Candidatus Taylorbacteria bacterium RIFCSPHIGHO2_01_FULL_46_22b TaxID=1802301 RepID=A0A1G2M280_9BACT|nr:MAG: DNA polymerase III subunit beta [Candidatus Taylorbacteria bacterium RIFCSPHIGHO2_01_FULL_46_22b]
MKVECVKTKISGVISKIERIAGKNQHLPILNCFLLEAIGGELSVSVTNLDLGVVVKLPVRVSVEGRVAVPAVVFAGVLSQLPEDSNVVFELIDTNFVVSTKHTKTNIKTLPTDDFPTIPISKEGARVVLLGADLIKGLQLVAYSSATSSMKPELSSVVVRGDHKDLVFVATDSFRLAEKKIPMKKGVLFDNILLPFKNVADITKIFEGYRGEIELSIHKNQIVLLGGGFCVVSRVVEGNFPDYQQIIPKGATTEGIVLKQDLVSALKLANIFSGTFHEISFHITPNKKLCELSSESGHVGKNVMRLDAVVKGEEISVSFNHRYIMDCFQSISGDSVSLNFNGPHKPLVIRSAGDSSFTYLVMPMNK